jgi:ABC-type nitrate/sulfonate/bicarbonate transport system substrate-binding protein
MANPELHQRFHDALREIARRTEAPDTTPEEYEQATPEQREREGRP